MKKTALSKTKLQLLLPVLSVLTLTGILGVTHLVGATGETITAGSTATTELKQASAISGIIINGVDNSAVSVKLLVTSGTLSMTTTTGLTFKDASGNTVSNPQTGSTLYFTGARSDVNTALATLKYTRNATGTDTLEVSLVNPGEVFFSGTGHLYEYVSSTLTWSAAKTAAEGRSKYGATGYLATITSQAENDFVSARLANAGWMGASDVAVEGAWKWVTGPESGTQFCSGNNPCNSIGGQYANWNGGEPNDSGGNEDCGQFLAGGTGKWNDLPCSGTTLPGYVVEYGAPGNLPTVAAANVAITTSDSVAPSVPGTPSTTSPTATQRPVWTWTASTDGGTGLASPAYSVQWSQSSSFASGVSSSTSTTTSFTQPSNLSDGQWYFRVRASDVAGNASAYSTAGSVVVDTTGPTQPDIGAVTIPTAYTPSTLAWNGSSDSGSGLKNPAYTVQWSHSATFTSGVLSATTNSSSYDTVSLTEGTWYFRIKATDLVGNDSVWSNTVTIIYDTTTPTTPGTPHTATPTNDTTPTWTWTASTDGGSGLAYVGYTIEWSHDPGFSGLGGISGVVGGASYTVPDGLALTDGTWYFRVLATDAAGNNSAWSAGSSLVVDTVAPNITDVVATASGSTGETLSWTTDKLSSSQVVYGPTSAFGSTTTETNTTPRVTSHSVSLSGLVACTLYHYKVLSVDSVTNQGNSSDQTFITAGCAGSATVTAHTDDVIAAASGGSVGLNSGSSSLTLSVPANFAVSDADFQIKKLDAATALATIGTPDSLKAVGTVYDLKAMRDTTTPITSFTALVGVTMSYTAADLTNFVEDTLTIYRWDTGVGWQKLSACTTDRTAHTVTCMTPGFSTFALFGAAVVPTAQIVSSHKSSSNSSTPNATADASATDTQNGSDTDAKTLFTETPRTQAIVQQGARHPMGKRLVWLTLSLVVVGLLWWFLVAKRRRAEDQTESHPSR